MFTSLEKCERKGYFLISGFTFQALLMVCAGEVHRTSNSMFQLKSFKDFFSRKDKLLDEDIFFLNIFFDWLPDHTLVSISSFFLVIYLPGLCDCVLLPPFCCSFLCEVVFRVP